MGGRGVAYSHAGFAARLAVVRLHGGRPLTVMLINKAHVKARTLEEVARVRPGHKFTRVSAEWYDYLEYRLRNIISEELHKQPSVGMTVRPPISLKEAKVDHD